MKEDILEQVVENWFLSKEGWFVRPNVKYRPDKSDPEYEAKRDSVHSDIDMVAMAPKKRKKNRVAVVSCKSWQNGFAPEKWRSVLESDAVYNERSIDFQKRERWKGFREIVSDKWIRAFLRTLEEQTGQRSFTYYIAVTKLRGRDPEREVSDLEESDIIRRRFERYGANINLRVLTLSEMLSDIKERLSQKETPVLESTETGRLLQLLEAAKVL